MSNPVKLVIDLSKPEGEREALTPMTDEEIAEREARTLAAAERKAQQEADEKRLADLKASARAKLVSGQPLTEEEAATLVI